MGRPRRNPVAPVDSDDVRHRRNRHDADRSDPALRLLARIDRAIRMAGSSRMDPGSVRDVRGIRDLLRRMDVGDVSLLARWLDRFGCDPYGKPWDAPARLEKDYEG